MKAGRRIKNPYALGPGRPDMWPLDAPGMPPAGPDFVRAAALLGDETTLVPKGKGKELVYVPGRKLRRLYRRALTEPGFTLAVQTNAATTQDVVFVPGHIWGQHARQWIDSRVDQNVLVPPVDGPRPAEVFVLGKMPWTEEMQELRNLVGPSGEAFSDMLLKNHIDDALEWYITNLLKFVPPDGTTRLKRPWINDCLPLLHEELRIVRPRYILCLGADASKELLGKKFNVGYMEGRVLPYSFPVHRHAGDPEEIHTAQVMTVMHPVEAAREQPKARIIERGLGRFALLKSGVDFSGAEDGLDYRHTASLEEACRWLDQADRYLAKKPYKDRLVAWDAEWEGQHPCNKGSYVATIQLSWRAKQAICLEISLPGGAPAFKDAEGKLAFGRLVERLNDFMQDKRAVGHFLVADLEWLTHCGIDPTSHCQVPLDSDGARLPWERLRAGEGWLDTGLMAHAIEENAYLGLESLSSRYTTAHRYDIPLADWKKTRIAELKMKSAALEGFGECPREILIPYACADADVTLRICNALLPLLDEDYEGNCCWEPCWESMITAPVILDMHRNGILVDRARVDRFTLDFMAAKSALEEQIKAFACWPDFNIRSHYNVREFLFGEEYNGHFAKDGGVVRKRPPEGISLRVEPLINTAKPPRFWSDIKARGEERQNTPKTDKQVLSILAQDNPDFATQINWIRDTRFLDTVTKLLQPPKPGEEDEGYYEDEDGFFEYDKGLGSSIDDDGRVRTHLYPTAETGRWKSARPPLQNLCVDSATEFLTRRGWIFAADLERDDDVAEYWPDTRVIDFVNPTALITRRYRGTMVHLTAHKQLDLLVTPEHRCLLRRRKTGVWFETPASADFGEDFHHIQAGTYTGGRSTLSQAWVTWLCAVQADGSYVPGGGIIVRLKRPRKLERLRPALEGIGAISTDNPLSKKHPDVRSLYVGVTANRDLVRITQEILGESKQLGPWLLECDRETLDRFVAELTHWDGGFTRGTSYSSSVKANADWAQILWTLSGTRATMRSYRPTNPRANLHHAVEIPGRRAGVDYSTTKSLSKKAVPWDDNVYCVTVPSSFVVVRRNGKVAVTGNSKQRDPDYERLLGERYKQKLRSILMAPPGWALVEFDYTGAELYATAIMSGDPTLIAHAQRGSLKESDPEYYDIHSNVAVLAFQLKVNDFVHEKKDPTSKYFGKTAAEILGLPVGAPCPATKGALKFIGRSQFRTLAKNVIFGLFYGRGAKAIQIQAREQKVHVTLDEVQAVIDAIFDMYPGLKPFFDSVAERVVEERWLCHAMGRYRRFPSTSDYKLQGDFGREGGNFYIQGLIASCVDRGLARLRQCIIDAGLRDDARLALQIHDAGVIEARYHVIEYLAGTLIPYAMRDCVPIFATDLAGMPTGAGPYHLGIDVSVHKNWGEPFSKEECREFGIPEEYAA